MGLVCLPSKLTKLWAPAVTANNRTNAEKNPEGRRQMRFINGSSRNGERLYYRTGDRTGRSLVAATVSRTARTFAVTSAVALFPDDLFPGQPQRNYDVMLGLNRFVMIGDTAARKAPDQIVVLNWFTELRARLRTAR